MTTIPLLEFTVPGKPMAKQRVRVTHTGHAYTPEKTLNYEALVMQCCVTAMDEAGWTKPHDGPVYVTIEARMPVAQSWSKSKQMDALMGLLRPTGRPDCDNFAKMLDALNNVAWIDDGQIIELRVTKWYSDKPCLRIVIQQG